MAHINFSKSWRLLILVLVGVWGHSSPVKAQGTPGTPPNKASPVNKVNPGKSEEPSGILFAPEENDDDLAPPPPPPRRQIRKRDQPNRLLRRPQQLQRPRHPHKH